MQTSPISGASHRPVLASAESSATVRAARRTMRKRAASAEIAEHEEIARTAAPGHANRYSTSVPLRNGTNVPKAAAQKQMQAAAAARNQGMHGVSYGLP